MNPGCRVQDQLNTSEPTVSYIIGRELNLRKLPGRKWESNPQTSEQLRPMTIKTSASTETATTAICSGVTPSTSSGYNTVSMSFFTIQGEGSVPLRESCLRLFARGRA